MKNIWRGLLIGLIVVCNTSWSASIRHIRRTTRRSSILDNPIKDIAILHKNLISLSSLKIIACVAPIYAFTRALDDDIHHCFYDHEHHKNVYQFHNHCHWLSSRGLAIPILLCGGFTLLSPNVESRTTGFIFLLGMPFVIFGKDLLKRWEAPHCLRPRNEHFSRHHRAHGGFPSGHMAEAMYMTVLFGMRYGKKAWIPLGAYSAFMLATFVNCNRHYVSQMVAGAALGAMYAVAANKLINAKLMRNVEVSVGVSPQGRALMQAGISF